MKRERSESVSRRRDTRYALADVVIFQRVLDRVFRNAIAECGIELCERAFECTVPHVAANTVVSLGKRSALRILRTKDVEHAAVRTLARIDEMNLEVREIRRHVTRLVDRAP